MNVNPWGYKYINSILNYLHLVLYVRSLSSMYIQTIFLGSRIEEKMFDLVTQKTYGCPNRYVL